LAGLRKAGASLPFSLYPKKTAPRSRQKLQKGRPKQSPVENLEEELRAKAMREFEDTEPETNLKH
jgi:hypothetical protein